jgi:hypothetical protein
MNAKVCSVLLLLFLLGCSAANTGAPSATATVVLNSFDENVGRVQVTFTPPNNGAPITIMCNPNWNNTAYTSGTATVSLTTGTTYQMDFLGQYFHNGEWHDHSSIFSSCQYPHKGDAVVDVTP